jgi:hypothetical protein
MPKLGSLAEGFGDTPWFQRSTDENCRRLGDCVKCFMKRYRKNLETGRRPNHALKIRRPGKTACGKGSSTAMTAAELPSNRDRVASLP